MNKRTFLKSLGLLGLATVPSACGLGNWLAKYKGQTSWKLASDETFREGI